MSEAPPDATPPRRATLKDVAKAAGVSQSTTSRALSGEGYVAATVRTRVLAAAEELGYVAHAMARSLRKQSSRSVGVLVSDLRSTFYADLAAGIANRARKHGYVMMLVDNEGLAEEQLSAAKVFVATRAAGVIVTPLSEAVPGYLLSQHIPVVEAGRQFAAGTCDGVIIDDASVAKRMTGHLIALGHRRIAWVLSERELVTGGGRRAGFQRALQEGGISEQQPALVVPADWDPSAARKAAVDLLARPDHPTAVFAGNGLLAEGVWRAASDLGLRVPDDLSIVSFDDAQWMSMVTPGITAIAQDVVALGETAMDRLLTRIDDPAAPPRTVVLEAQIRLRESTAPPAHSTTAE